MSRKLLVKIVGQTRSIQDEEGDILASFRDEILYDAFLVGLARELNDSVYNEQGQCIVGTIGEMVAFLHK